MYAPWTIWWRQNFFADILPWLEALMATTLCQLAVVATGAVTTLAGVTDVYALVTRARGGGDRAS